MKKPPPPQTENQSATEPARPPIVDSSDKEFTDEDFKRFGDKLVKALVGNLNRNAIAEDK